jgi:hypothetical protein
MTKEKLNKFHQNTVREVNFYANLLNEAPEDLITAIQNTTLGLDSYGNPTTETFKYIAKKYDLPYSVAKHFFYLI